MILESRRRVFGPHGHADIPVETRVDAMTFDILLKLVRAAEQTRMQWLREAIDEKVQRSIAPTITTTPTTMYGKFQIAHDVERKCK